MAEKVYIAIDLKSFYASVECMERGLNPMTTNLVVADKSRTEKTICLAVSPALKKYGIPGRPRLFEVVQKIAEINQKRKQKAPGKKFSGTSVYSLELEKKPELAVDYVIAPPQMAKYITISRKIYEVYLKYIAPEDMHVYSIDEVFIDATGYLGTYKVSARELARQMILDVLKTTGITATAGIGTNLYLCKVAMDIGAKHIPADEHGVRIAELDEKKYRQTLWSHTPLTDFWRVGRGYADKLAAYEIYTMGDIARCSIGDEREYHNEELLYNLFGVNAELLIDHAWGYEPCTMEDIKAYRPESNSIGSGQVLPCAYLERYTCSSREMMMAAERLYDRIVNPALLIRRLNLTANHVSDETSVMQKETYEQLNLFTDYEEKEKQKKQKDTVLRREKKMQEAMLTIKKKYGKNAILKGVHYEEGATGRERNNQIGGHKA